MRRFRLKPAHILWFERILHKMDVTIVNPICARLAQPGHDVQVSIETSTMLPLDCCLSDVQDPAKHQPSIQWRGLGGGGQ